MARIVTVILIVAVTCVWAAPSPAPEPSNPKFTLVKDTSVGIGAADGNSKAHGVVRSNKVVETPIEVPVDTGKNVPDVTLVDNVNAGAAFASSGSVATGVLKVNKFADKPAKGAGYKI